MRWVEALDLRAAAERILRLVFRVRTGGNDTHRLARISRAEPGGCRGRSEVGWRACALREGGPGCLPQRSFRGGCRRPEEGELLAVGDPRHEWYVDWLVLQTK